MNEAPDNSNNRCYPNPSRVGRMEYVAKMILLIAWVVIVAACIPGDEASCSHVLRNVVLIAFAPLYIYLAFVYLNLTVCRLHDIGFSGWWFLAYIVFQIIARNAVAAVPKGLAFDILSIAKTSIDLGVLCVLVFYPGDKGSNKYGAPPEYPRTLAGRLTLSGFNPSHVKVVVVWSLVVIATSLCCRLFHQQKDLHSDSPEVVKEVVPMPQSEIERILDGLTVRGCDYEQVRRELAGQMVTLTNASVVMCGNMGNGWTELFLNRDGGEERIIVLAYVPTVVIESYARDPLKGESVLRLTGRVITEDVFLRGPGKGLSERILQNCPYAGNAIWLDDVKEFDVSWKGVKRPSVDAGSISGDDFARIAASCPKDGRDSMCARMLAPAMGRELTFSSCRVVDVDLSLSPNVTLEVVHPDSGEAAFRFSVPLRDDRVKKWARSLAVGTKMSNVRATVCRKDDYERARGHCSCDVWMTDVSCGGTEDVGGLPDFDASSVSGDDLIALLSSKMKRPLALNEVKELEKRLDGRDLSFSSADFKVCGTICGTIVGPQGEGVTAVTASFPQARLGFSFDVKLAEIVSESAVKRKCGISGKVVAPSMWVEDRDADRFVIHMQNGRLLSH